MDGREDKSISTDSLLELAKCVLENNVFEHNGDVYIQKQGTAIGTKMAPNYAILFMGDLEEKILDSSPLKPLVWWRYIDDVFFLWQHGEESLKLFLDHLNQAHPTIKFTSDYSDTSINFLDVKVSRKGDRLATDLYVKPTDIHQYLDATSCHPNHCKTSIAFSQALRLNRICSEPSDFDVRCNDLESWLIKRGYDQNFIRKKVLDARRFKRQDLLNREKKSDDKKSKITLNITFHPAFQNLGALLRKIHQILACNEEHHKVFKDIPTVGFRKGKSLRDFLVRAKVPPVGDGEGPIEGASGRCYGMLCEVCDQVKDTTQFTSNGKTYNIRNFSMDCNSTNVVYLLSCKVCGIQYVGSTTCKFRSRFNTYKSGNRRYAEKKKKVPQKKLHSHFDQPGHSGFSDFEFTLIDQGNDHESTRKKERFWMYKLNTFLPDGLNEREVVT